MNLLHGIVVGAIYTIDHMKGGGRFHKVRNGKEIVLLIPAAREGFLPLQHSIQTGL
jgi:hypothetical protein